MKPVWLHSAECGECNRPPGQPARTRRRSERYTRVGFRECPRVSGGVTWKAHPGAKQAKEQPLSTLHTAVPSSLQPACSQS